jgi:hypothetical protein
LCIATRADPALACDSAQHRSDMRTRSPTSPIASTSGHTPQHPVQTATWRSLLSRVSGASCVSGNPLLPPLAWNPLAQHHGTGSAVIRNRDAFSTRLGLRRYLGVPSGSHVLLAASTKCAMICTRWGRHTAGHRPALWMPESSSPPPDGPAATAGAFRQCSMETESSSTLSSF